MRKTLFCGPFKFVASVLGILISFQALSAPSTSAKLPKKNVPSVTSEIQPATTGVSRVTNESAFSYLQDRVSVALVVPTGTDLVGGNFNLQADTGERVDGSADISTNAPFGLSAQYKTPIKGSLDLWGALTLEGQRSLDSVNLTAQGRKFRLPFTDKPSFRPIVVEGGLAYQFNTKIYAMTGMNYSLVNFIQGGQLSSMEMTPAFGYNLGIGARVIPELSIELAQREVRYTTLTGKLDDAKEKVRFNDLKLAGLTLLARYNF